MRCHDCGVLEGHQSASQRDGHAKTEHHLEQWVCDPSLTFCRTRRVMHLMRRNGPSRPGFVSCTHNVGGIWRGATLANIRCLSCG